MMFNFGFRRGVRAIALFEAAKGALVVLAGCGALRLLHHDAVAVATEMIGRLHLNPSHKYPGIFIEAAAHVTDVRLWFFATFAAIYATFRFLEAYGLWHLRPWAEWLALVSGGIYLPIEVYELIAKSTWIRVGALTGNLLVVVFMGMVLLRSSRAKQRRPGPEPLP